MSTDALARFLLGVLGAAVLLLAVSTYRQQARIEALEATVEAHGLEIVVEKPE